jgi:hypothetical protein
MLSFERDSGTLVFGGVVCPLVDQEINLCEAPAATRPGTGKAKGVAVPQGGLHTDANPVASLLRAIPAKPS